MVQLSGQSALRVAGPVRKRLRGADSCWRKACQPKTLSINNPPTGPEVMHALPCNLIIITGGRTLTRILIAATAIDIS